MSYLEPEWAGTLNVTCEAEVERKTITPGLRDALKALIAGPADPWDVSSLTEEQRLQRRVNAHQSLIQHVQVALAQITPREYVCGYSGPADVTLHHGRMLWTCPVCGEDHNDLAPAPDEEPDPDRWHDERREV